MRNQKAIEILYQEVRILEEYIDNSYERDKEHQAIIREYNTLNVKDAHRNQMNTNAALRMKWHDTIQDLLYTIDYLTGDNFHGTQG